MEIILFSNLPPFLRNLVVAVGLTVIVVALMILILEAVFRFLSLKKFGRSATTLLGVPRDPHDPMDWRQTDTSTVWKTGTYCANCFAWTHHEDRMAEICHECGSNKSVNSYRSSRKIWDGHKWVTQHKYGDGPKDFTIE